jgi:hypothetical protein
VATRCAKDPNAFSIRAEKRLRMDFAFPAEP